MFLSLIPILLAAFIAYLLVLTFTNPNSITRGWLMDLLLLLTCAAIIAKILVASGA